jgi:hypothetical protein
LEFPEVLLFVVLTNQGEVLAVVGYGVFHWFVSGLRVKGCRDSVGWGRWP